MCIKLGNWRTGKICKKYVYEQYTFLLLLCISQIQTFFFFFLPETHLLTAAKNVIFEEL